MDLEYHSEELRKEDMVEERSLGPDCRCVIELRGRRSGVSLLLPSQKQGAEGGNKVVPLLRNFSHSGSCEQNFLQCTAFRLLASQCLEVRGGKGGILLLSKLTTDQ